MSIPKLYRLCVEPDTLNPDGFVYVWAISGSEARRKVQERRKASGATRGELQEDEPEVLIDPLGEPDEHNGWPNYETWAVFNWLSSTERAWNHVIELSEMSTDRFELANRLRDLYESQAHNLLDQVSESASVWSDLLIHAVQRVDFDRIARSVWSEREDEPSPTA